MTLSQGINPSDEDRGDDAQPVVKADLRNLKSDLGTEIAAVRSEAKTDNAELKADITTAISSLSRQVIFGTAAMVLAVLVPVLVLMFTLSPATATVPADTNEIPSVNATP